MSMRKDRTRAELADFARLVVRAGYLNRAYVQVEVGNFVRAEVADESEADDLTQQLIAVAESELQVEQQSWPARTDNDALADTLADLKTQNFLVLEYCQDHFDATGELKAHPGVIGIVFFTETDVWHAVSEGMLELKVWHADTSNVVEADPELALVLDTLSRHGLTARFDEGRIEISVTWRRRHSA